MMIEIDHKIDPIITSNLPSTFARAAQSKNRNQNTAAAQTRTTDSFQDTMFNDTQSGGAETGKNKDKVKQTTE